MLRARAVSAKPGAQGFDCDVPLNAEQAKALIQFGYDFAVRYVSRSIGRRDIDLSASEAQIILDAGLALMAVQHVAEPGWMPTQALGGTYGNNAGLNAALMIGMPARMSLWLDLEGAAAAATVADTSAYVNSWADAVASYGFAPGLYVGASQPLDAAQLGKLWVNRFWRSASRVPEVAGRGYCMTQSLPMTIAGIDLDRDVIMADKFGDLPTWLVAS